MTRESDYIQQLEEENAKLRQEIQFLKSKLFAVQQPLTFGFAVTLYTQPEPRT